MQRRGEGQSLIYSILWSVIISPQIEIVSGLRGPGVICSDAEVGTMTFVRIRFVLIINTKVCGATAAASTKASLSSHSLLWPRIPGSNPDLGAIHAGVKSACVPSLMMEAYPKPTKKCL